MITTMINEDYVSFETAKLLKEKGLDVQCKNYFSLNNDAIRHNLNKKYGAKKNWNSIELCVSRPSLSLAMKWLRKVHHLYIQVMLDSWACGGHMGYYVVIQNTTSDFEMMLQDAVDNVFYDTYEEACESAIKYCLENLI